MTSKQIVMINRKMALSDPVITSNQPYILGTVSNDGSLDTTATHLDLKSVEQDQAKRNEQVDDAALDGCIVAPPEREFRGGDTHQGRK